MPAAITFTRVRIACQVYDCPALLCHIQPEYSSLIFFWFLPHAIHLSNVRTGNVAKAVDTRTPASTHHAVRPLTRLKRVRPQHTHAAGSLGRLLHLSHAGQLAAERLLELGDDGVVGDGFAALVLIHDLRLHVELLPRQKAGTGQPRVAAQPRVRPSTTGAVARTVASCFCEIPLALRAFCSASFSSVGTFASAQASVLASAHTQTKARSSPTPRRPRPEHTRAKGRARSHNPTHHPLPSAAMARRS